MTNVLNSFQLLLMASGFPYSTIFGGPQPEVQGISVAIGQFSKAPAEGFAVPEGGIFGGDAICPSRTIELPRLNPPTLKDRLNAVTRGLLTLFKDADIAGWKSVALPVPEIGFFGDLDHNLAVRAILGSADIFWRTHHDAVLSHVIVVVDAADFTLSMV